MDEVTKTKKKKKLCRILSLDGGGAKGFYTLGVLKELEAMISEPLCNKFDLIFGTSTGSIIAALLALGYKVDEIHALYKKYVPSIMKRKMATGKSKELSRLVKIIFGERMFTEVKTAIGIVATNWNLEKPMIFKADIAQAHGRQCTFVPGFGCTIADAVRASCSAYPFFNRVILKTEKGEHVELMDGGYCANNPTLYAIADALMALKKINSDLRVVSIGVGNYPEPKRWFGARLLRSFKTVQLLQKTMEINTTSMEQLRIVLFNNIKTVRINDTFERPEMATDLLEHDLEKLDLLYQRGSESFASRESQLKEYLL